jgi:hypothetical protein
MKQVQLNYKNVLLTLLGVVMIAAFSFFLYVYKLDADFHKPLSCERIAVGYLSSVHDKYNNHPEYEQIIRRAIEVETEMFNLCNSDITES